jgi:hypothetical protein
MSNLHTQAFKNRQSGSPDMRDGLIETAGMPVDSDEGDAVETAEIESDPDTLAAISEGEADIESGDISDLEDDGADDIPVTTSKYSEGRKKPRSS